mgnify:FL=1
MEIITAREAFNRGLVRYFTGKSCKNEHVVERMISNGGCVDCLKEKTSERRKSDKKDAYEATKVWRLKNPGARAQETKRYREKYPDKVEANQKRYREKNIDKIREKNREAVARIRKTNPEKEKQRLQRFYTKKKIKQVIEAGREKPQLCEICLSDEFRIVFDHCHNSGKFRGWICDRCNRVLGIVRDSPKLLRDLSLYLEKDND